jgi:hypothetical protein
LLDFAAGLVDLAFTLQTLVVVNSATAFLMRPVA